MESIIARKIERLILDERLDVIPSVLSPLSLEQRRLIVSKKIKQHHLLVIMEDYRIDWVKYFIKACIVSVMKTSPHLCTAVENGFPCIMESLVKTGSDVNELDSKGFSPLYFACIRGDMFMVDYLLKNGAEVNLVANVERITPLKASLKYPEICKYLLTKSADPQLMNSYGKTALMMAVESKDLHRSMKVLLGYTDEINFTNIYGENAIFLASQKGFTHIVNLLKSYGVDTMEPLARCYQFQACYAALNRNQFHVQKYWKMYTRIQGLPSTTPPFEIEHPNSRQSCFAPILYIFDPNYQKVFLYLEKYFDLCNPYTLQALETSMDIIYGFNNRFQLFSFILETLALCNDDLFFNTLPRINNNIYRKLNMMVRNGFDNHLENGGIELLKTYSDHVEEIAARLKRMNNVERALISVRIDSVFYILCNLIQTLLKTSQGNMSVLKESIEKIVRLDLRGSDNNTLLHYCTKNKYSVEMYKVLLLCKAKVNCRNRCRFTPVHYMRCYDNYEQMTIIEYSLVQGFLFDASIDQEFCLSCLLKKRKILQHSVKYTTLQCLAANVVSNNLFSYEVPRHLEDFILSHISNLVDELYENSIQFENTPSQEVWM